MSEDGNYEVSVTMQLINEVDAAASSISASFGNVSKAMDSMASALNGAAARMQSLAEAMGNIAQPAGTSAAQLDAASSAAEKTAEAVSEVIDPVQQAAEEIGHQNEVLEKASAQLLEASEQTEKLGEETKEAMRPVQQASQEIEKQNKILDTNSGEAEEAAKSLDQLSAAQEKADKAIDDASAAAAKESDETENLSARVDELEKKLSELTAGLDKVSDKSAKAGSSLGDLDSQMRLLGQSASSLQSMGSALTGMSQQAKAWGMDMIQAHMRVEEASVRLQNTLGTDASMFGQMKEEAERLGVSLPGSTEDMMNMFAALREQGVSSEKIIGGVGEATANFATLFHQDFGNAAMMVGKFQEALGYAAENTSDMVDLLSRLQGVSGLSTEDLYGTFRYAGSALKTLGIQGKEASRDLSAVLGIMANAGIEGTAAGTGLAAALSRMASLGSKMDKKDFQKRFGDLGIELNFFDENGEFGGVQKMVSELGKLGKLTAQQQMEVLNAMFGEQAARPMQMLIKAGKDGLNEMKDRMNEQLDAQTKIDKIMQQLSMKWGTAMGTIDTVKDKIGTLLVDIFDLPGLLDKVNGYAEKFGKWLDDNPGKAESLVKAITALVAGAGILGTTLTVAGTALGAIAGIASGIGAIFSGGALAAAGTALSALAGAAAVAAAAGALIYKYWEPLKNFFSGLWDGMAKSDAWEKLVKVGGELAKTFKDIFQPVADTSNMFETGAKAGQWIASAVVLAGEAIGGFILLFTDLTSLIGQSLGSIFAYLFDGGLFADITALQLAISKWLEGIAQSLSDAWNNMLNGCVQFWEDLKAAFRMSLDDIIYGLKTSGEKIVGSLIDGMSSKLSDLKNATSNVAQTVRGFFPFSPAKEGPLRDLHKVRIVETIAEAMHPEPLIAASSRVAQAVADTAVPVRSGYADKGGLAGVNMTYSPVINMGSGAAGAAELMAVLRAHSDELLAIVQGAGSSRERLSFA